MAVEDFVSEFRGFVKIHLICSVSRMHSYDSVKTQNRVRLEDEVFRVSVLRLGRVVNGLVVVQSYFNIRLNVLRVQVAFKVLFYSFNFTNRLINTNLSPCDGFRLPL